MSVLFPMTLVALLMVAAWRDVTTRTIPNTICLLLLVVGAIARTREGLSSIALSAMTALLLFVLLMIIYSRHWVGGGDVKIMTSLAVGLAPLDSYRFVVVTAIAGGLLGIAYFLLSRLLVNKSCARATSLLGRVVAVELWRIRRCGPLPYGVAIAVGGGSVLLHLGSF